MKRLGGKVAVVTGASKGIGAAIALALAHEGAAVVVGYAGDGEGAARTVAAITGAGGRATSVQARVERIAEARALIDAAADSFGGLDIVVNNAGVYRMAPLGAVSESDYRWMFDVNVLGTLLVTQAAAERLRHGGSVVNISSAVTRALPPGSALYTASKGAVDVLTGVLAAELGPRGIRVNAISPGMTDTEGNRAAGAIASDVAKAAVALTPLGRLGTPEDVAALAVFLAGDEARWVTGEVIAASGGLRR